MYLRCFGRGVLVSLVLFGLPATPASADLFTVGHLTTDTDIGNTISDSLNNREWLRWNILAHLTYDGTVEATTDVSSPAFGYSIATAADAALFLQAAGSTNPDCTNPGVFDSVDCVDLRYPFSIFGDNYNSSGDYVFFLNDAFIPDGVGQIYTLHVSLDTNLSVAWLFDNLRDTDEFSNDEGHPLNAISWLLFKEVNPVPIPAAIWLFGAALVGLIGFTRSRKTA